MRARAASCGAAVVLTVWASCAVADTRFSFVMEESQVVPPSGSTAFAKAVALLNDEETEMTFVVDHDVASPVSAAVYVGTAGTNGTKLFTFSAVTSPIVQTWPVTATEVAQLNNDELYIQIASAGFPSGDIRGQIAPKVGEPGDVIITEIMYNPASDEPGIPARPEWIELFNPTLSDIRIGGWFFQDEDKITGQCTLRRSGSIPAFTLRSFDVVVIIPDGGASPPLVSDFKTAWGLGPESQVLQLLADGTAQGAMVGNNLGNSPHNDGIPENDLPLLPVDCATGGLHTDDEVLTLNDGAQIIDVVNYDDFDPWPVDNNQSSITLVPADFPTNTDYASYTAEENDLGSNWRLHANGDSVGGRIQVTAAGVYGGQDIGSPCFLVGATTGNQPPTANAQTVMMGPGQTKDVTLTGADATRPFFGLLFFIVRSLPDNGQLIDRTRTPNYVITPADVSGGGYLIPRSPFNALRYVNNGTCGMTGFDFQAYDGILTSPVTRVDLIVQCGGIVISEIMYNPASSEPTPSLAEWVELYNATDGPIDLAGWYLEDDQGRCGDLPSYILGARSAVAVIPSEGDGAQFVAGWSAPYVQPSFDNETSNGSIVGGNLANAGDKLRLVQPGGGPNLLVADAVYYGNGGLWPQTFGGGSSLYVLPPTSNYTATQNDNAAVWGLSQAGTNGAYQVLPTMIYNGSDIGSPGVLAGLTMGDCAAGGGSDGNGDGLVDNKDHLHFVLCYSGAGGVPPLNCGCFDGDGDGDVDCRDRATFEMEWTGPPSLPPEFATCPPDADCCGDLDGDGMIALGDFASFAVCFGFTRPPGCSEADYACSDVDGNGVVDLGDFSTFAVRFNGPADCNEQ